MEENMLTMWEKNQAEGIMKSIMNGAEVQLYCTDGSGVRPINPLLSDDQMNDIAFRVTEFLQQLIDDINDMAAEE